LRGIASDALAAWRDENPLQMRLWLSGASDSRCRMLYRAIQMRHAEQGNRVEFESALLDHSG